MRGISLHLLRGYRLRWKDIDFDAGTLGVGQALERSGGDRQKRRSLSAEKRDVRKAIAAAPPRSAKRRDLDAKLETLRKDSFGPP